MADNRPPPEPVEMPPGIEPERIRIKTVQLEGRPWVALAIGVTVAVMTPDVARQLADELQVEAAYAATVEDLPQ